MPDPCYDGEVQQWTGLVDRLGKEIYEGDIVEVANLHDENVQWWSNGMAIPFPIEWRNHGFELPSSEEDIGFNWKVIGNIYENPELLSPPQPIISNKYD